MSGAINYQLFKLLLQAKQQAHFATLIKATKNPAATQTSVLNRIVRSNHNTQFGEEHKLASVDSVDSYRNQVPVRDFDALAPWIHRQRDELVPALTSTMPVHYNRTSGTTGAPKDVPITALGLEEIKQQSQLSAYVLATQSSLLRHKIFVIGGAAVEDFTNHGIPIGSAAGMLYRRQSRFIRSRYILPPEVFDIDEADSRYLVMAILGLAQENVTLMATANPSTFLNLAKVINTNLEPIVKSIADGKLPDCGCELPPFPQNKQRAHQLTKLGEQQTSIRFDTIWPQLSGVITWCGGSCGIALGNLESFLPPNCGTYELGYNASEFRGSINIDLENNLCVPTLQHTFFEFVEQSNWERGVQKFLELHELQTEQLYYVVATTSSGLYRYNINDLVRVSGWINATPTLQFVQKGKGVTNITGEKVTEYQILACIESTRTQFQMHIDFFVVLADEHAAQYLLCIETETDFESERVASHFDSLLQSYNIEYAAKRKSGRLHTVGLIRLATGTSQRYQRRQGLSRTADAQYKYLCLQYRKDFILELNEPTKA